MGRAACEQSNINPIHAVQFILALMPTAHDMPMLRREGLYAQLVSASANVQSTAERLESAPDARSK